MSLQFGVTSRMFRGHAIEPSAIPDSVVNRIPFGEGVGDTIADSVGNADGTLAGPSWESDSTFRGGTAPEWDGIDDYGEITPRDSVPLTVTVRFRFKSTDSFDYLFSYASENTGNVTNNNGLRLSSGAIEYCDANNNTTNEISGLSTDTVYLAAVRVDSSTARLDIYDNNANPIANESFSNPNTGFSGTVYLGDRSSGSDLPWTGNIDLMDFHDEYVTNIDSVVADVYT